MRILRVALKDYAHQTTQLFTELEPLLDALFQRTREQAVRAMVHSTDVFDTDGVPHEVNVPVTDETLLEFAAWCERYGWTYLHLLERFIYAVAIEPHVLVRRHPPWGHGPSHDRQQATPGCTLELQHFLTPHEQPCLWDVLQPQMRRTVLEDALTFFRQRVQNIDDAVAEAHRRRVAMTDRSLHIRLDTGGPSVRPFFSF